MAAFDIIRRAAGLPTGSDRESARSYREQLATSADPADAFAAAIADKVSTYGLDQANRALPELAQSGGKWSRDPEQRWADVARTARGIADAARSKPLPGMDPALAVEVDRQFLSEAAREFNGRGPVARQAEASRAHLADGVRSLVSGGRHAEENAYEQVVSVERKRNLAIENRLAAKTSEHVSEPRDRDLKTHREWLMHSTRAYMAMARTGLLKPEEIVGFARDAGDMRRAGHGSPRQIDWSARERADTPDKRRDIVRGELADTLGLLGSAPRPPSWERKEPEVANDLARVSDVAWLRGDRAPGRSSQNETVGERAGQEIREALSGRVKMRDRYLAPAGTMLRPEFLENGSTDDLHLARVGRIESIKDESFRMEMTRVARHSKGIYHAPEPELGYPVQSANNLIRDLAQKAVDLTHIERFSERDFKMGPVPLSPRAQRDIDDERGRLRTEKMGLHEPGITIPGRSSRGHMDELAHRYMAIMLRDTYENHPLMARKLDLHADELRRNDPSRNQARGVNIGTDMETANKLTIAHEAERHLGMHYGRSNGYARDGADFRHIYTGKMGIRTPEPAERRPAVAVTAARTAMLAGRQMG